MMKCFSWMFLFAVALRRLLQPADATFVLREGIVLIVPLEK